MTVNLQGQIVAQIEKLRMNGHLNKLYGHLRGLPQVIGGGGGLSKASPVLSSFEKGLNR
jgi:hypothetical protein